jgi:hypothetical protein
MAAVGESLQSTTGQWGEFAANAMRPGRSCAQYSVMNKPPPAACVSEFRDPCCAGHSGRSPQLD